MKFDLISVIFRLHGWSTVFRNFLKNVKTLELKTYIKIFSIPQVISGRNIKRSIFPTLCHISSISLGPYRESLLIFLIILNSIWQFAAFRYIQAVQKAVKHLKKNLSSISAPLIPTESTSTFHSTNLFLFSCHHILTNGVAPLSAYKNAFMVFKKLEIKFSYLAFILFHKLSVLILESLDFELHCQRQVTVSELTDLSVRDVQKNIKYPQKVIIITIIRTIVIIRITIHSAHYLFSDWPKTYGEFLRKLLCKYQRQHVSQNRITLGVLANGTLEGSMREKKASHE